MRENGGGGESRCIWSTHVNVGMKSPCKLVYTKKKLKEKKKARKSLNKGLVKTDIKVLNTNCYHSRTFWDTSFPILKCLEEKQRLRRENETWMLAHSFFRIRSLLRSHNSTGCPPDLVRTRCLHTWPLPRTRLAVCLVLSERWGGRWRLCSFCVLHSLSLSNDPQ
jgi:hypothetical protein